MKKWFKKWFMVMFSITCLIIAIFAQWYVCGKIHKDIEKIIAIIISFFFYYGCSKWISYELAKIIYKND